MVVTRSGASTRKDAVKIKFNEDGENPEGEFHTADEGEDSGEPSKEIAEDEEDEDDEDSQGNDSESDSDSDDAPEEESTAGARKEVLKKQQEQIEIQQEKKKAEREKRKRQDEYNKQQKQSKKPKVDVEQLPEFLPEELIESLETEEHQTPKNTHIRLDIEDEKELRRQAKLEKLANIKKLKSASVKMGPVNVKVQSFNSKKTVPKAESKIVNSREKWLKRKSLNKK
jgi:U3 small nucleolar RNA-associated protein 16